ncbi:hypothetical protein F5Y18DRAFT_440076 [Xylariaceae sp. FL1019]|nr:hypothetical protein F5Y18DRAFT_440076 [Xylariaceae sp. FL1019]
MAYPAYRNISTLSVDSYLGSLGNTDDDRQFIKFIENVYVANGESLVHARKVESHFAKIRQRINARGFTGEYSAQQHREREAYHAHYDELEKLKKEAKKARNKAKVHKESPDPETVERTHNEAMRAIDRYFETGVKAAQARLDFMLKNPAVYTGKGHVSHVHEVERCLGHAKDAHMKLKGEMRRAEERLTLKWQYMCDLFHF